MSYIYNLADTWNDGGTVFTAIKMNVTDSASDAASLLMDLQVGGTSKFSVAKDGTTYSTAYIGPSIVSDTTSLTLGISGGPTTAVLTSTIFRPETADVVNLGSGTYRFGSLFLGSGAFINWNDNAAKLTASGASYSFQLGGTAYFNVNSANIRPNTNDQIALGSSTVGWSDLYIASGGKIDWANADVLLTHSSNALTLTGGQTTMTYAGAPLTLVNTNTGSATALRLYSDSPTPAVDDNVVLAFYCSNAVGTQVQTSAILSRIWNVGAGTEEAQLEFYCTTGGTSTRLMRLSNSYGQWRFYPNTDDLVALGHGLTAWSDLFLASGGKIDWANADVLLTHSANALTLTGGGLILDSTYGLYSNSTFLNIGISGSTATLVATTVAFRPAVDDGQTLGNTTYKWGDLFLASGGVINWSSSNVKLTHASNQLYFEGTQYFDLNYTGILQFGIDKTTTPVAADDVGGYIYIRNKSVAGNLRNTGYMYAYMADTTDAAEDGWLVFGGMNNGSSADRMRLTETYLSPTTNDLLSLGTSSLKWSDLHLASGAVINFNSGDVTITHSANQLGFAGGNINFAGGTILFGGAGAGTLDIDAAPLTIKYNSVSKAVFATAGFTPTTNDAYILGSSSLAWSDLFLASGGTINWNASDVVLTHSSNALTLTGGQLVINSDIAGGSVAQKIAMTDDTAVLTALALVNSRTTYTSGDTVAIDFRAKNSVGAEHNLAEIYGIMYDNTSAAEYGRLQFRLYVNGAATAMFTMDDTSFRPTTNDLAALGSSSTAFSDLYLASGGVINWATSDITLTHATGKLTGAGGNFAFGDGAIATTATDGFLYVPTCAGTPTGTPTTVTGYAPIIVDTTNNKLYFYSGAAWRDAGP